jgi:glycosyltransferase involved in cell wall biosynthesis
MPAAEVPLLGASQLYSRLLRNASEEHDDRAAVVLNRLNSSQPATLGGSPTRAQPEGRRALHVALMHVLFGPYHVARARALLECDDLDVTFIEVAGSLSTHPWRTDPDIPLVRLADGEFHEYSAATLSRRVRAALDSLDPDAVVSCGYGLGVMRAAARWARRHRRASILLHETTRLDRPRQWWREQLKRQVVTRLYDTALCGGERNKSYLRDLGIPDHLIWVPYDVVDNDYYRAGGKTVKTEPEKWRRRLKLSSQPYFLYVGRFDPEKNLTRLVDAFAQYVKRTEDPWSLVLVGAGEGRRDLLEHIDKLELAHLVTVHPFAQANQLIGYYGLAGCFVLPSCSEPWGLVVNEAAAVGLPLLVSNYCGCVPELLQEGANGYLFDPTDERQIAVGLERMAALPLSIRAEMGERSRAQVDPLSLEAYAGNLRECIYAATRPTDVRRSRSPIDLP